MRVHIRHLRDLKYCTRGARQFFAKHGFDWSDFLKNGIEQEKFLATGDVMAIRAVEQARKE